MKISTIKPVKSVKTPTTIKLAGESIIIGSGTVPNSPTSIDKTNIKKVVSGFKKASELGVFDYNYE